VAGCAGGEKVQQGTIGYVEGFPGGVAADEPRAALIGRDILTAGGTAADAAVAVYFALSVTMPSSASLGGGGVCLVRDDVGKTVRTLDFLARAPEGTTAGAERPSAIPGNPRGFYALYSRYGRMRWEQLLGPAENLARFGTPVSRAFAHDLAAAGDGLLSNPETARIFGASGGSRVLREGETLTQVELASVIGQLRRAGPGDFYAGGMTRRFVDAVRNVGGTLGVDDMRNYRPEWRDAIEVSVGNNTAHFTAPPGAAGGVAAEMAAMLIRDESAQDADEAQRLHLLAETAMRAFADRGTWLRPDGGSSVAPGDLVSDARIGRLMTGYGAARHTPARDLSPAPVERPENPAGTSFVVIDPYGAAVACSLTANGLFGTGRLATGTGVLLAARPGPAGHGPTSLGAMMVSNEFTNNLIFTATASGGAAAPTAMANVAARALLGGETLDQAMRAKRVHHGGFPDITFVESGMDAALKQSLSSRGHTVSETAALGRVNAAFCSGGLPNDPKSCSISADIPPRGYGLATSAD